MPPNLEPPNVEPPSVEPLDRDLFVQAFWTKCREVIRPELDRAVDRLRHVGQTAEVSSLELDTAAEPTPGCPPDAPFDAPGPSLTLATGIGALSFYGDVARQSVCVDAASVEPAHGLPPVEINYDLDQLDEAEVASIVAAWEASLIATCEPAAAAKSAA